MVAGRFCFVTDRVGLFYSNTSSAGITAYSAVSALWVESEPVKQDIVHELDGETWVLGIGILDAKTLLDCLGRTAEIAA